MYLFKVEIKKSSINGNGVFALENISKGEIVWIYKPGKDKILSVEDFKKLDKDEKLRLNRIAYLSPSTNRYVYPPKNDPALFTNHSMNNNLSVIFDKLLSDEPFFIANKDINIGEEITNNYLDFDNAIKDYKPEWL